MEIIVREEVCMRGRRRVGTSVPSTLEGQPVGAVLRLTGVDGDRRRTMRLLGLGLRAGAEVVVTNTRGGGVIVASEAGRVAIGPEMARHIRVERVR